MSWTSRMHLSRSFSFILSKIFNFFIATICPSFEVPLYTCENFPSPICKLKSTNLLLDSVSSDNLPYDIFHQKTARVIISKKLECGFK